MNNNVGQGKTNKQYEDSSRMFLASIIGIVVVILISLIK